MIAVDFPECNCTFVADGCENLPAAVVHNDDFNSDEVISMWELSDDDLVIILKQVKAGIRPAIHLSVIGGQPPVALWVRKDGD